jgi:glutamine amidotransferase
LESIEDDAFFYFVHSYYCEVDDAAVVIAQTEYGCAYPSVVAHQDLYGVQFHPEKSQTVGLQLLNNFARRVRLNF